MTLATGPTRVGHGLELLSVPPLPSLFLPLSGSELPCWKAGQRVGSVTHYGVCLGGQTPALKPYESVDVLLEATSL